MSRPDSPSPHPVFDSYALPRAHRCRRSAAALSVVAHLAIVIMVLWRGAVWFESRGGGVSGLQRSGGQGGGQPATTWVVLPDIPSPQARTVPPPPPSVTVPTVALPLEPVKLDSPPRVLAIAVPPSAPALLPAPVDTDEEPSGAPAPAPPAHLARGNGSDSSGGREPGLGAISGAGSGGSASDIFAGDIFGPTPLLVPTIPVGAPPADQRKHDVQFWVRADGHVTRIEVSPPIRDSGYRRRFMEVMTDVVFGPVTTRDGRPIDYVYSIVVDP